MFCCDRAPEATFCIYICGLYHVHTDTLSHSPTHTQRLTKVPMNCRVISPEAFLDRHCSNTIECMREKETDTRNDRHGERKRETEGRKREKHY